MEKEIEYTDDASRSQVIADNPALYLREDRIKGTGEDKRMVLVFSDEAPPEVVVEPTVKDRLAALEARG